MNQQLSEHSTNLLKEVYRFLKYKNQRKKVSREVRIRKAQNLALKQNYDPGGSRLIVFLVPGSDWATGKDKISGGTMSIVSICQETRAMGEIHGAQTILCTPGGEHLFLKHEMFQNDSPVFRFSQLAPYFNKTREILIHIPEFLVQYFPNSLSYAARVWLKQMDLVHINIMNQNIRLMPQLDEIDALRSIAGKITISTAHQKYCSPYYRDHYGLPIHKLSVWISPEQYQFREREDKENLLVASPDPHPMKEQILQILENIPGLTVQIIKNLTYTQYKELIARAKWSVTFGEGLDGYLIEPVFSGAIGFAVYNEIFFTPDFRDLSTVYESYEQLIQRIAGDIHEMDRNKEAFVVSQKEQYDLCASYYSYEQYRSNIRTFYRGQYTLP
jgi:hypothetical protein